MDQFIIGTEFNEKSLETFCHIRYIPFSLVIDSTYDEPFEKNE